VHADRLAPADDHALDLGLDRRRRGAEDVGVGRLDESPRRASADHRQAKNLPR
jgi:hypothetical protein